MNEVPEQIIKGSIISKSDLLKNPAEYDNKNLMCIEFGEGYLNALLLFSKEVDFDKPLEVILHPWPEKITERAIKFFFALRDRVCKASEDESKEYKNNIYHNCIKSFHIKTAEGIKESITQLNKQELWQATELMYQWGYEAGAYMGDFTRERGQIRKELEG